jgi:hypothetical protein
MGEVVLSNIENIVRALTESPKVFLVLPRLHFGCL